MRSIVTDLVVWSVGRLVSPAKTAEPIEMLFELRTQVGPGNYVPDGGLDTPWKVAILRGERASHCQVLEHSAVICAKTAEPIEMTSGLWVWMGPRNNSPNSPTPACLHRRYWHE